MANYRENGQANGSISEIAAHFEQNGHYSIDFCRNQNVGRVVMFRNHHKKLKVPFIICADIETLLKPPTKDFSESTATRAYQESRTASVIISRVRMKMLPSHIIRAIEGPTVK